MIRYALACDAGHAFDSWFRSSEDFDTQVRRGFVTCPTCHSSHVFKQIMAPRINRKDREESSDAQVSLIDSDAQALRAKMAALHAEIIQKSEDVGFRFAEEARSIHLGETEARSIRGRASIEEARGLIEDGIAFLPLPDLPDDRN